MFSSDFKKGYLNSDFKLFHLIDQHAHEFDYHYHDFHKIVIFISGNVQYFVEGKSYDLKPYDLVLVNRNDMHRVLVKNDVPYERIIVYISPSFINAYLTNDYNLGYCFEKAKEKKSNVLRIQSLEKSALFRTTTRLEHSFEDSDYAGDLYRQILFLEFMIQLNRAAIKNHLDYLSTELYNEKVTQLITYINEHLTQHLSIDELAEKVYLSKYYMMRLFKEETGFTIGQYINQKRLLLARDLLSMGESVNEACYQSGFQEYSTFSRAYKKEFGESPTAAKTKIL